LKKFPSLYANFLAMDANANVANIMRVEGQG